jgi:hypothetical protein
MPAEHDRLPDDPVLNTEAARMIAPPEMVLKYRGPDLMVLFSPGALRVVQIIAFVLLALGILAAVQAAIRERRFDPVYLALPIMAGFVSLSLFPFIWRIQRAQSRRLVVGQKGIALFERGRGEVILWKDLGEFRWRAYRTYNRYGQEMNVALFLEIEDQRGGMLLVNRQDYNEVDRVRHRIEGELIRQQFAAVWQRYQQGHKTDFGAVTVGPSGLTVEGAQVPWSDVRNVRIDDTHFLVSISGGRRKGPLRVDAGKVPNLALCLALIDKVLEVVRPPEQEDTSLDFQR